MVDFGAKKFGKVINCESKTCDTRYELEIVLHRNPPQGTDTMAKFDSSPKRGR